jgi:hypothetical protein
LWSFAASITDLLVEWRLLTVSFSCCGGMVKYDG